MLRLTIQNHLVQKLFLSVYDAASKGTFTLDLGVSVADLVANKDDASYLLTYDLSTYSDWNNFKAAAGSLTGAVYSVTAGGVDGSFNPYVLATGSTPFVTGQLYAALNDGVNKINGQALKINTDADDLANFAANNTTFVVDADGHIGQHGAANSLWGSPMGHNPNTAYGDEALFQLAKMDAFFAASESSSFAGTFNLSGDSLSYGATPSQVPVPAAAWLFGSALLGMAGIRRRNVTVA